MKINLLLMTCSVGLVMGLAVMAWAGRIGEASGHTQKIHAGVLRQLPFADQQDFEDARRGFIAPLPDGGVIRDQEGRPVWDLSGFSFIKEGAASPETVNPSRRLKSARGAPDPYPLFSLGFFPRVYLLFGPFSQIQRVEFLLFAEERDGI